MRIPRQLYLCICLALTFRPAAVAGEEIDPSEFLRRAETVGLSTHFLRRLLTKISLRSGNPGGGAEAAWGYIRQRVTFRDTMLEEGTNRLRFDLPTDQLATAFHELTHAANSVMADPKQPRIAPAASHHFVIEEIRSDLFVQEERNAFLGLPRYPRVKADEVTGYFMGLGLMEVFDDAHALVSRSLLAPGAVIAAPEDAERLGDKIMVGPDDFLGQAILSRRYGRVSLKGQVYFQGTPFSWDANRSHLKDEMWAKFLALDPPRDGVELLQRLNTLDNAWLREQRSEIVAARKAYAAQLRLEAGMPSMEGLIGAVPQ